MLSAMDPFHMIDPGPSVEGEVFAAGDPAWAAEDFDDATRCGWWARRHPAAGVPGPRFGPGGDDVELWGKTEAEAHRWLRTQTGWPGYTIVRIPRRDARFVRIAATRAARPAPM